MRTVKIVSDSSSDVMSLKDIPFASVPMKVITDEREFIDDENIDLPDMIAYLEEYKGESKSSCPNVSEWLSAFGDADDIFCVTITSGLSGS